MSLKKPDNIVFNQETGVYDASLKSYPTNVGAPVIKTPDTVAWKNNNLQTANAQFKTKYQELKFAFDTFKQTFEHNELVYRSKFSFEPIVGEVYHLYKNRINENFLSIVSPNECNFDFTGSFVLNSDKVWTKVN
jgi:hypothetical protein